jgi:hypothetical protein
MFLMHFVLLTWNPGPLNERVFTPEEWDARVVAPYLRGETVEMTWGVGRHVNNIEPGDTAFMYRQGAWGRGIVARGTIRTRPWTGPNGRTGAGTTNHVDVEWRESVPTGAALELGDLEAVAPEFGWRQVYASGRQLPAATGAKVSREWEEHLASYGSG